MEKYNYNKPAVLICLLSLALISCDTNIGQISTDEISLPPGFIIETYADVPNARSMVLSENGILFVGTRSSDKVYAVVDNDNDYKADEIIIVASGLRMPNGVAIKDGALYVAEVNRILKYENIENTFRDNPSLVIVRDDFPTESHHGWKFIRFGPDEKLYVPVGAPCNVCLESDERFASITRMNSDGTDFEIFANGIRNTVGFDWHPMEGWYGGVRFSEVLGELPPNLSLCAAATDSLTAQIASDAAVTVHGTVGVEAVSRGVPTICADRNYYSDWGFTHEATSREHYAELLSTIHRLPKPTAEQRQRAMACTALRLAPAPAAAGHLRTRCDSSGSVLYEDILGYLNGGQAEIGKEVESMRDWLASEHSSYVAYARLRCHGGI